MVPINYLAVLASAIVMMVLGYLWYGPIFGKMWTELAGLTPEKMAAAKAKGMTMSYVIQAIGALLTSFVLAHAIVFAGAYMQISGIAAGLEGAFWNWLGFVAPATVGMVLWEGKPWKYWFIVAGYYLVSMLVIGVLLGLWV